MDVDSPSILPQLPHFGFFDHSNNDLAIDHQDVPVACGLCGRNFPQDGDVNRSLQTVSMCGDCKFLLLEDLGTPTRRRQHRRRSTSRHSDSVGSHLTHQFSQMINLVRDIDHEQEDLLNDDTNLRLLQSASSHTTPSGSRRWRRIVSDTESDGFNSDSFYGESESNVSFSAHRVYHGDSDLISFSTDGGDSDATVEGLTFLERDIFVQSMERTDIDSDSDIDPMHVGTVQWNSDDHQAEHNDWEEVDAMEHAIGSPESGAHIDTSGHTDPVIRHQITDYPEFERMVPWSVGEGRHVDIPSSFPNMEEFGGSPYIDDAEDYLNARDFEEFVEHLDDDSSRRGAPPAAVSFVNSLPLVLISDVHQKPDGLACAICRDLLVTGTEANQLPCLHLYHPSCILPWLSARNSCPLCRYELPTDDIDYERGKHDARSRMVVIENQQHYGSDDNFSIVSGASDRNEAQEVQELSGNIGSADASHPSGGQGRLLFLGAAPIISLVGIVAVLWLGNPLTGARCRIGQHNVLSQLAQPIHTSGSGTHNHRARRWRWWF